LQSNFCVPRVSQLLGLRKDENGGAMPNQQARPRAGGQPEPAGERARGLKPIDWL